jgi:hypothetical protein
MINWGEQYENKTALCEKNVWEILITKYFRVPKSRTVKLTGHGARM